MRISASFLSMSLFVHAFMYSESFEDHAQDRSRVFGQEFQKNNNSRLSPELVEAVLRTAPAYIIMIIKNLRDESLGEYRPKQLILEGPSGTGKTTLAEVIAYESGRDFVFIDAHNLKDKYQNSGSVHLQEVFDFVFTNNNPQVVVIDEITRLVDQHSEAQNADKGTGTTLWRLLDKCAERSDILVVGTTNEFDSFPSQLKDRFRGDSCKIDVPHYDERAFLIKFFCEQQHVVALSPEITEAFMLGLANKTQDASVRSLKKLVEKSVLAAANRASVNKQTPMVKPEDFDQVIQDMGLNKSMATKAFETTKSAVLNEQNTNAVRTGFFIAIGAALYNVVEKNSDKIMNFIKAALQAQISGGTIDPTSGTTTPPTTN